jgi:PAS domain S-box-containing protein
MKKCLIVDDEEQNRYLLEKILQGFGYRTTIAENGAEALDKARQDPPDLIITDILMPVMDGYALCLQWKSDDHLKHIPLIFYTATYTEPKDKAFALSLRADRFILKPQTPDALMNIIKEVLEENNEAKQVGVQPLGEEMEFFRQHNEILFKKLEKKMQDLEAANQRLKCLEEQYRLSFENVADIVWTTDTDLIIQKISPSVEKMLGYKPQDLIGQPMSDLLVIFTPELTERAMAEMRLVLGGQTIAASVYPLVAKDGSIRYWEISGSPILRNGGEIIGMISVVRDITDRRRAEERLLNSEASFQELFNDAPVGYFEYDAQGCITRVNQTELDMLGYSSEEVIGQPAWKFIVEEETAHQNILAKLAGTLSPFKGFEREYRRKDGTISPLFIQDRIIKDERGNITGIRCTLQDITELKRTEKQLRDTLATLRKSFGTIIQVMVSAVETRDPYTAGHQTRSADLARAIAMEMGLPQEKIEGVRMAGSIHDIGKLSIPAEILTKPVKLTEIEFSLIKEHSRIGYEILKDIESPWPLAEIVYQHHERMDGSGYPRNLKGDEFIIEARIMAVADVVESISSYRPYRPALGINSALEEIEKNKGTLYDTDAVDACLRLFREKNFKIEGT